MAGLEGFTEADVKDTLLRTLRLLAILTVVGMALVGWKLGWRSSVLLLVGAAISGSGLWEWMRLMSAVMARMDASSTQSQKTGELESWKTGELEAQKATAQRPVRMGFILVGFFLRLGVAIAVLYVSLKYLHGSVIALAVGLGLGIVSLTFEALKMAKEWTV